MSPGKFGLQSALASCVSLCSRRQFRSERAYWTGRVHFSRDRESQTRSCGTTCLQEGSGCPYPGPFWWKKEGSGVLCKDRIRETPLWPTRALLQLLLCGPETRCAYGWKTGYRWGASGAIGESRQVRRPVMPSPYLSTLLCLPQRLG